MVLRSFQRCSMEEASECTSLEGESSHNVGVQEHHISELTQVCACVGMTKAGVRTEHTCQICE